MRRVFVWLHRYVGLAIAGFLVVEGLTGSLLAFSAEINTLLDPKLSAPKPSPGAKPLDPATLQERAAEAMPEAVVGYFTPRLSEDQVVLRMVWKSADPPHVGEPDLLILDPWTGKELGRRPYSGDWSGDFRRDLMPFVFKLHANLALGGLGGWLLGAVALAWTIDCFVGFYLTLPVSRRDFWRRWKPAWLVKWGAGAYRINFDLHRASGLWLWAMLFVFAWSSVELDSITGVYGAVMGLFGSDPTEFVTRIYPDRPDLGPPKLNARAAQARGEALSEEIASREGFHLLRPISLQYFNYAGRYNYSVLTDRSFPRDRRLTVYFDSNSGEFAGLFETKAPLLGDTLNNWLLALHQIRDPVDYLAYRILVALTGVVIAMLSVTGVYLWWKKRSARLFSGRPRASSTAPRDRREPLHSDL